MTTGGRTRRLPYRPDYDVDRVRAFSDCVFAVGITLLVLRFVTPDPRASDGQVLDFVVEEWPRFLAYLSTFVVIGVVWLTHHRLFEIIERVDPRAAWLNLGLLSLVVLLPFPMQLLGLYRDVWLAYVVFNLTTFAMGLLGLALVRYATTAHRLVSPSLDARVIRAYRWRAAVLPVAFGAATLASFAGVLGSVLGWCLFVVALVWVRRRTGTITEADTDVGAGVDETLERAGRLERDAAASGTVLPFTAAYRESGRLARLTGFSDCVYGFAITLIVLQLDPDTPAVRDADSLWRYLTDALHPDIVGYFVGFAVVGLLWHLHNRQFLLIERQDGSLRILNLAHLMVVAMMPFATLLLSTYSFYRSATVVFALIAGLAAFSLACLLWYATHHHRLVDESIEHWELAERRRLAMVGPAVFGLSIPVALVSPVAAQLLWLAAGLVVGWTRVVRDRQGPLGLSRP